MKLFSQMNENDSVSLKWEDRVLRTTKNPQKSDDGKTYTALAVDALDNKYILVWAILESGGCDFYNPIGVTIIK